MFNFDTLFVFVLLPFALSIGYFSLGLSNAQALGGLKRGVPMKASLLFSIVGLAMFYGGIYSGIFLQGRSENPHSWIPIVMFAISGVRALQHAWRAKSSVHIFDIQNTVVAFTLSIALGVNVYFVGVGISYLEVSKNLFAAILFPTLLILSFSGLLLGNQFKSDFGRKLEFAAGIFLISMAFWASTTLIP